MTEPLEFYPTPDWAIDRLIDEFVPIASNDGESPIYEPCVGDGAIVARFRARGCTRPWIATDVQRYEFREGGQPETFAQQSCLPACLPSRDAVTNPPFSLTEDICKALLASTRRYVVVLVRMTFLGSEKRAEWLRKNPPDLVIHLPRRFQGPNGRGGTGTDASYRAWLVWDVRNQRSIFRSTQIRFARY